MGRKRKNDKNDETDLANSMVNFPPSPTQSNQRLDSFFNKKNDNKFFFSNNKMVQSPPCSQISARDSISHPKINMQFNHIRSKTVSENIYVNMKNELKPFKKSELNNQANLTQNITKIEYEPIKFSYNKSVDYSKTDRSK